MSILLHHSTHSLFCSLLLFLSFSFPPFVSVVLLLLHLLLTSPAAGMPLPRSWLSEIRRRRPVTARYLRVRVIAPQDAPGNMRTGENCVAVGEVVAKVARLLVSPVLEAEVLSANASRITA